MGMMSVMVGNSAVSWIHAAVLFDCELSVACPKDYSPLEQVVGWAKNNGGKVTVTENPMEAVSNADCVITDTFISMGDEGADRR